MDIKRGDTVYYRGQVWTVRDITWLTLKTGEAHIERQNDSGGIDRAIVVTQALQRVEQVR